MPKRKIRRAGNPVGRMARPGQWLKCGSGNTGPRLRVVQVSGGCSYDQCVEVPTVRATSCDSTIRLDAYDYGFTNKPDQFTWGQSGGIVSAGGGVGDDFIEIDTTSGVDVSISVTLTATDSVSGDSAAYSGVQTARHTDITQPALFIGPDINDVVFTEGVDIGIFSFRPVFGGCVADDFAVATGTLPDGLTLSSLGLLTGTPTTPGTATGLSVSMTSAGGVAVTNTFDMTVQDVDAPSVLIVRDTVGICNINPPSTTCIAVGTYAVTNANFTNPPTDFVWSISTNPGGVAIINGQGTDTVDVQSSGSGPVTFTLKCVVTDFLSGDTAENVDQITHSHNSVDLPDFWALTHDPDTYEMLGVREGVGDLTTTHTSEIYAKDYLGVYQKFPANAPVWSGGRCVLSAGAGSDVTAVYADDGTGTLLAEVPYLQYYPAAENKVRYSNNLSVVPWSLFSSVTVSFDQVGLTGAPNTASLCNSVAGSNSIIEYRLDPATGQANTEVFYIKKTTGATTCPVLIMRLSQQSTARVSVFVGVDTNTGRYEIGTGTSGTYDVEVVDAGDWWKCLLYASTGLSVDLAFVYIAPADVAVVDLAPGFSSDPSLEGSCIVGNVEIHLNKTISQVRGLGPIFTTTAAVATDRTAYSFDASNQNPTEAAWYYESIIGSLGVFQELKYTTNASVFTQYLGNGYDDVSTVQQLKTEYYNGAGYSSIVHPTEIFPDTELKNAEVYSQTESSVNINSGGVWATDATNFSNYAIGEAGILVGADANLSFNRDTRSFKIRNLRRYDIASYAEGKTIIDGLMA